MVSAATARLAGRLLALIEIVTGRENDAVLTEQTRRNAAQSIARYTPAIQKAGRVIERRWTLALTEMRVDSLPTAPISNELLTDMMLAYWQERISYQRNEQIAELRRASGLTQEGWAKRLGVSVQAVRAWEQHARTVPDEYIALAKGNPGILN